MDRLLRQIQLLRGKMYKYVYKIEGGKNLRLGEKVLLSPRGGLKCGMNVVVDRFSEILGRVIISDDVHVHRNVLLRSFGGTINIGKGTTINPFVCIYGQGGVTIGKYVSIATKTTIVAANHNYRDVNKFIKDQGVTAKGIVIEDDVWIGAHAVILDNVHIGKRSIIAAGAVVNRDVNEYAIVGGGACKDNRFKSG